MTKKHLAEDQITRLPKNLVKVGEPLGFPVYDTKGQLLMQTGMVITSAEQLERLIERGLYLNKKTAHQIHSEKTERKTSENKTKEKEAEPVQKLVDLPIESINLNESLQISPLTDDKNNTKYTVKFLGGLNNGSIICTLPKVDDKIIFVKEHAGYRIQLFSGKEVYSFTSVVEAVYNKPYPHMHLKFPQGVYSKNLRSNQRAQTSIITSLLNKMDGDFKNKKTAGRIIDISLGGAMIETNAPAGNKGDELECTFKLNINDAEVLFSIHSVLRSIIEPSQPEDNDKFRQGIQFKDIDFQDKMMLQNYLYQLLTGKDLNDL